MPARTVPARDIDEGEFFRKRTGKFVYLRIKPSALEFHKVPIGDCIYGVCYNGGLTAVSFDTQVVRCSVYGLVRNITDERRWEDRMGVKRPKRT